ncbi:uncharacterized protein LOC133825348 [Humulus lupulus]|uniref:uncharacterized protein LOC133825348 n=1 Tax=Humulus lupulus TaxID=3486 RepID=UPI002B403E6D|nr:uncharacterized protein LOC133825348 [Humulus lupulus]
MRKLLSEVGLGYEQIDVCQYECALFFGENANATMCLVCKSSCYVRNKIPHKRLRWFPIKARLKRLFSSKHTAKVMRWHNEVRRDEPGILCHPADGDAWKHFDKTYPEFAVDLRTIRMGLASDGFNPFSNMTSTYNLWSVILIQYNMPPWASPNGKNYLMSLLIPGPKSPGKDYDVFLRPLIEELKELWEGIEAQSNSSSKRKHGQNELNWCKKSVLFEFSYWSQLLLRHNLDVMHIEKNVCHNIIGTLLDIEAKSKDTLKARKDLENLKIRSDLWLKKSSNNKMEKPHASYTLAKEECKEFCKFIQSICAKTIQVDDIIELKDKIIIILCKLEKIFPPSFSTIMVHLCVRLPDQVLLGSPVSSRWMFGTERHMALYKKYVSNIETRFTRYERNWDFPSTSHQFHIFNSIVRPIGASSVKLLDSFSKIVQCEHKTLLEERGLSSEQILTAQMEEFPSWFKTKISELRVQQSSLANDDLYSLSQGPLERYISYHSCIVNGVHFWCKDRDDNLCTQCFGVCTEGDHDNDTIMYYGVLLEILQLSFLFDRKLPPFQPTKDLIESSSVVRRDVAPLSLSSEFVQMNIGGEEDEDEFIELNEDFDDGDIIFDGEVICSSDSEAENDLEEQFDDDMES